MLLDNLGQSYNSEVHQWREQIENSMIVQQVLLGGGGGGGGIYSCLLPVHCHCLGKTFLPLQSCILILITEHITILVLFLVSEVKPHR